MIHAYKVLTGKPEGKRPQGRPRRTWEDNIEIERSEYGIVYWIRLIQDMDRWRAVVDTAMNIRVP